MRVAIYARISQDRDGEGINIQRQVKDCTAHAQRRGWTIVKVYEDNDISAMSRKPRPSWQTLLDDARRGLFDGILAWRLDRLQRRPAELEEVIDAVEGLRLRLELENGLSLDLNDAGGKMYARQLCSAAAMESDMKSERITRAFLAKAENGQWKGGNRPLGYEKDGVTVVEREAEAIRDAAAMIIHGHTLSDATRMINARLGLSKQPRTLRDTLLSKRIIGRRTYTSKRTRAAWAKEQAGRDRKTPCPPDMEVEAEWPAILDRETWENVGTILRSNRGRTRPGIRSEESLLSRLLFCGRCGHHLGYSRSSYACPSEMQGGCGGVSVRTEPIHRYVNDLINELLTNIDESGIEVPTDDEQVEYTSNEDNRIEKLQQRRRRVEDGYLNDVIDAERAKRETEEIDAELDQYRETLDQRRLRAAERQLAQSTLADWARVDVQAKNQALRLLMRHIIIHRTGATGCKFNTDRIEVHWADGPCDCREEWEPMAQVPRVHHAG